MAAAPTPGAPTRRGPSALHRLPSLIMGRLRRVQWPDRARSDATSIVIGFVIIAGLYLGLIDWVANKAVDFII